MHTYDYYPYIRLIEPACCTLIGQQSACVPGNTSRPLPGTQKKTCFRRRGPLISTHYDPIKTRELSLLGLSAMNTSNMATLEKLKDAFTALVGSAEPSILPAFFMWMDIRVAEYKCNGYMFTDSKRPYESTWAQYSLDKYESKERGYNNTSPLSSHMQTEALELTKTPEKKKKKSQYNASSLKQERGYSNYQDSKIHDIAYPKEASAYSSHLSPVYGSEACGINLSMKSSQQNSSESPLKLKVPSIYQNASSPEKTATASPTKQDEKSHISADTYSSLRSLLQANKAAIEQQQQQHSTPVPVNVTPSVSSTSLTPSQLCASPIKSDTDSTASSPGPADIELKDLKKTDCPYCGKKFQYRSSFRRHMKIHQGVYTHICAACSRKFTRKEHFVRHKCNRKPNIPNRSATRVEMTPETMLPSSKLPQPKVAYPPTLDESRINSLMAADLNSVYKAASLQVSSAPVYPESMMHEQYTQSNKKQMSGFESDGSNSSTVPKANESRRKKAMPRKVVANEADEEDDIIKAYDSPVATPITIAPIDEPSSPEDLSSRPAQLNEDHYASHMSSLPIEITPKEGLSAETISTATGTYQIEQCKDEAIKVTKQSNYLKLRKEAQMINGQLCFVCPHCTKVFHRSSNFSRHMRIHRGVFSYICPACNRGFYRKEHFQKHKCTRKSMARIWSRKTKIEMEAESAEDATQVPGNGTNPGFIPEGMDDSVLEEGVDLGSDNDYYDESTEEGSLIVDESATNESPASTSHHVPANMMHTPPVLTVGGN